MKLSTVKRSSTVTQLVLMPCASNMLTGVVSELSSVSLAHQWDINYYSANPDQWTELRSLNDTGGFGAELTLGRAIKDGGRNIAVIKQERSATSWFTDWFGPGAPSYDEMVAALPTKLALFGTPIQIIAVCCDILHLDATLSSITANAVGANISTFRAALRTFLGLPNLLFIFDNFADTTAAALPFSAQAETSLSAGIAADPVGRSLLNDCSLYPTSSTIQPNHFTTAAEETCGNDWAAKVLANT